MVAHEDPAGVWVFIDADDGLAFELGQHVRHFILLFYVKGYPISFRLPVGRVHIKESVRAVIALDTRLPA